MPTFSLSLSPSVNRMFRNVSGIGRVKASNYRSWIRGELKSLVAQRARPVQPPVSVRIVLPIGTRGDPDNRQKAVLDLLKRAGIIPDDSGKIIKSLIVCYGAGKNMEVSVESV